MLFLATQMKMRIGNGTSREHKYSKTKEGRCKPMNVDKSATNKLALDHTSMKAWNAKTCTSLATQNGFLALTSPSKTYPSNCRLHLLLKH
jgi:hypothetical protein